MNILNGKTIIQEIYEYIIGFVIGILSSLAATYIYESNRRKNPYE